MDKEPITVNGLKNLKSELEDLKNVQRRKVVDAIADFPVELLLFEKSFNYVDRNIGKNVHQLRCNFVNYLCKNNNSLLRIKSLINKFPKAKFLLSFRNPLDHSISLLKQKGLCIKQFPHIPPFKL